MLVLDFDCQSEQAWDLLERRRDLIAHIDDVCLLIEHPPQLLAELVVS